MVVANNKVDDNEIRRQFDGNFDCQSDEAV